MSWNDNLTDNQNDVLDAVTTAVEKSGKPVELWTVQNSPGVRHMRSVQLVLKSLVNKGVLVSHEPRRDGPLPNWTQKWSVAPTQT